MFVYCLLSLPLPLHHLAHHAQGPTVSPVYTLNDAGSDAQPHLFAATICVPKKKLYPAVKELRRVGGLPG